MKIIFDKLLQTKRVVEGADVDEVKRIVDDEIDTGTELTFIAYDNSRQALNKRIADSAFPSIRVSSANIQGIIETPFILSPSHESYISLYHFFIQATEFEATNGLRERHQSTLWQIARDEDFQVLVYERNSVVFKTAITIPKTFFDFNETYYIRVKYIGKKYQSNWSNIVKVITQNILIEKPVIYTPMTDDVVFSSIHLTSSPFITVPAGDATHKSSLWQMAEDIDFIGLVWEYNTPTFLRDVQVPPINILHGRDYYLRVQYIASNDDKSAFSNPVHVFSDYKIQKPYIVSPVDDTYINRHEFNIIGSDFETFPVSNEKLKSFEIKVTKEYDTTDIVYNEKIDGEVCECSIPKTFFDFDTVYQISIKYYGEYSESAWSDVVFVRTNKIVYKTPIILSPLQNALFSPVLFNLNCSPFETVPAFDDAHKETIYQISENLEFDLKVIDTTSSTNLTFLTVTQPTKFKQNKNYYIRVKYVGNLGESEWSDVRTITSYGAAIPITPEFILRDHTAVNFGTDAERRVGTLLTDILLSAPGDQIIWSKWLISRTPDFSNFNNEKIEATHPKEIYVDFNGSIFGPGSTYFVKVAFKTITNQNYTQYSDVLELPIGTAVQPVIEDYEFTCPSIYENHLTITGSDITGPDNFDEFLLLSELEISDKSDFSNMVLKLSNSFTTQFSFDNSEMLKKILYFRLKYHGYYFGESIYSEPVEIDFGHIEKPEILNHVIINTELNETTLMTIVGLTSSEFVVTQDRKDTHKYSRWIVYPDEVASDIVVDSDWVTNANTYFEFAIDLNSKDKVYCNVTYGSEFLGESEKSELHEVILDPYIFTPVFLSPYDGEEIRREAVTLTVKDFFSVPSIAHTSTHWVISSDQEGNTIVWENESSSSLTTINIPSASLLPGERYYAHVTFKSGLYRSKTTSIMFDTIAVGSVVVTIQPVDVIVDGAEWRIAGTENWYSSGYTLTNVMVGNYSIEFKNLMIKWKELANQDIVISKNSLTEVTGTYEINGGTLQVVILPQQAADGECAWRRVGTETWHESGYSEIGVLGGIYEVEFFSPDLDQFIPPDNIQVLIVNAETTVKEVEFTLIGQPGITLEELKVNYPLVAAGRKRIPPETVTVDIINGDGTIEPTSLTVPYMSTATFEVVGGFIISSNDENIVVGGTLK